MYVDHLGVLGTSRVNVDRDLAMAVQTLRNRGLATHEEAVHSETTTAVEIDIDLRNMLVSVLPTRRCCLKQGLRWALRKNMARALGTHDVCGPAPTRCAHCALYPE